MEIYSSLHRVITNYLCTNPLLIILGPLIPQSRNDWLCTLVLVYLKLCFVLFDLTEHPYCGKRRKWRLQRFPSFPQYLPKQSLQESLKVGINVGKGT